MTTLSRLLAVSSCLLVTIASCKNQTSYTTVPAPAPDTEVAIAEPDTDTRATSDTEVAIADPGWHTAVEPKPLSDQTSKGLQWLAEHQLGNGGWGQGDESVNMRGSTQANMRDTANVADTSMAVLALMRSGSTAKQGPYKDAIARGLGFVLAEIEESDQDSLYITGTRGTRVQSKIGTYVDTFTALVVLTEAKGQMPNADADQRVAQALAKVLAKIEKNQRDDGTWDNRGWAPVLSQSMAAKGLNRAAQSGEDVDDETLVRVEGQARAQFDSSAGSFGAGGSAGVELYAGAANNATMRESMNTRAVKVDALRKTASSSKDAGKKAAAERELAATQEQTQQAAIATESAERALIKRLKDPSFISGFGNNGGEEFLSYMLVSESLVVDGGQDWKDWDVQITKLVHGVQNADGSWTGHHCITGRTFCTAAALLVLMADRTPVPMASKLKGV